MCSRLLNVQFTKSTRKAIVAAIKQQLPASAEIIELSCGRGHLLDELLQLGYSATGTNYSLYEDALPRIPILNGVDVTDLETLPDKKYDCVILSEAIQNIADHHAVYRSMRHLLREGGIAIISTPNSMNLRSRLHFLFTGFFKVKWNVIGFDVPPDEAFCYHNHPVHLPVDAYYAHVSGLGLHNVGGIHVKFKSLLLYGVFVIPVALLTAYTVLVREPLLKHAPQAVTLLRMLTSFSTLTSERLIIVFRHEETQTSARHSPQITWYKRV